MASGERITIVTLLMIALVVVGWGLHKRWWVPGWMLADCEGEKEDQNRIIKGLREQIEADNERRRIKLEVLEGLLQEPAPPRRTSSRRGPT
jgi:hypothetical protein